MKYKGCILDYTKERNKELVDALYRHLRSAKVIRMPDICKQVADSPCSRFWVSEERATIIISAMLAGRPISKMRENKREMFEEIFRRFAALRPLYPDAPIFELVTKIVHQPAPKFYLTHRTVGLMLQRVKNGWYDRKFNRYRHLLNGLGDI